MHTNPRWRPWLSWLALLLTLGALSGCQSVSLPGLQSAGVPPQSEPDLGQAE